MTNSKLEKSNFLLNAKNYVFIINSNTIGGHEHMALNLILHLKSNNKLVNTFCTTHAVNKFFITNNIPAQYLNVYANGNILIQIAKVPYTISKIKYMNVRESNIIICGGTVEAVANLVWAFKLRNSKNFVISYIPMVIDRKITHGFIGIIYNKIIKIILSKCDMVLTINKIQQRLFRAYYNINALLFENVIKPLEKPKISFGKRLIYIGRLEEKQKNIVDLIKKLDNPINPFNSIHFYGSGPDETIIRNQARNSKWIKAFFYGWLPKEELNNRIGANDVLILNSRWEGEPLVAKEFKLRNLICIGTDIYGHRGVIKKRFRYRTENDLIRVLYQAYRCC